MSYCHLGSRTFVLKNPDAAYEALYQRAVRLVRGGERVTVHGLGKLLGTTYPQVHKIIARMESEGVVAPPDARGVRRVLVSA